MRYRYQESADIPNDRLKDRISQHMTAIHQIREDPGLYAFQDIAGGANYLGEHIGGAGEGVRRLKPKPCPGCKSMRTSLNRYSGAFSRAGSGVARSSRGASGSTRALSRAGQQTVETYWGI